MNPNKALWEKGDFTQLAETMRQSGEELVATFGIEKGMAVLDLACGDGNTAIPEAKLGAEVTGIDIATNLIEAGIKRIKSEGLSNCKIIEGDASNLSEVADDSFDLVVSIFGAMFAPNPMQVAKEMVRVAKPGGKVIMGNWIPNDPTLIGQVLTIISAYTPPPPEGFVSPMTWGVESHVTERFSQAGIPVENIKFSRESFVFRAPYSSDHFVSVFKTYYGPTMNAFDAAEKHGKAEELQHKMEQLFSSQNNSNSSDSIVIPATFLKVTVQC